MQREEIQHQAKIFCKENNITKYPVDIIAICEQQGITVFEEYLSPQVSGFLMVNNNEIEKYGVQKVIVVNLSDSAKRRRFTIAHELAHFLLHKKKEENIYAHRDAGQRNEMEREADEFASCVLMPEDLVKEELQIYEKYAKKLFPFALPYALKKARIAEKFAVSEMAADVRLHDLQ